MENRLNDEKAILSQAFAIMGSRKTAKKAESARENGRLGGRPTKPLSAFECICGVATLDHKAACPLGRAIRHRQKKTLSLNGLEMKPKL